MVCATGGCYSMNVIPGQLPWVDDPRLSLSLNYWYYLKCTERLTYEVRDLPSD